MSNSDFFIDRPATDDLLQGLKQALQTPANSPVVFQAYGIGGIGKSTLTKKIQKYLPEAKVIVIEVTAVGLEEPRAPLTLMNKIYQSLPSFNDDWREEFPDWYKKYEETRQLVERDDQGKTLIKGTQNLAQAFLPKPIGEAVKHGAQAVLDAPDKMEQFEGFLAKFAPTKGQSEEAQALKKLMLKPYEVLTGYFVKAVQARLRQQPVVMVLDVYEKVGQDVDQWLLRYLLQEYDLQGQQFRVVITGRNPLRDRDGWHDLAKNRNGYIREIEIPVFDRKQTQQFLDHYKIQGFEKIFELTKGWPYYLNKIAQQAQLPGGLNLLRIEGIDLEENLSRLLLGEQVTEELKKLVNLAACCRQFNRELLEILWRHFYPEGWTEELWADLQGRSFVLGLGRYWQFDDVSRDIFRKVLFNNRPDHFEAVNAKLQGYFQEQSAKYIPDEDAWPQKYGDLDWLRERTNALYYGFFLKRPDFTGFIAHLLEAVHFNCGEQVIAVMEWIEAETPAARHAQLSDGCKKFLNVMEPLTSFIGLWLLQDPAMVTESAEQEALNTVWRYAKKSLGLAKFTALHLQSGHEQQSVAKELLLEARKLADDLVVDDDPEFSSGLFLWELGNKFHENESYEEAIASYDRTIFFKHDYHEAWSNRGISLDNLGRYEDAIASYDRAISFKHDYHEAWSNRGNSLGNLGRYEEAIASYDRAISFKHDLHEAWSNRGISLGNLGRYEEAIASYDRAISFKHDKHEAWYNRGNSLGNLGRYEEAIESYDRAISFKHDYHEAWSNRGISLGNLGRYEEAIASYDRAISFKHDKHEAWYNRGNSLDNLGRYEEAIASYDRAISFKHDLHEAWSNRGNSLGNLGRYEEAIESYDRAISFKHDKHEAWSNRGVSLDNLGRYEEAIASYDRAISFKHDLHEAWSNRGNSLRNLGRYEEAIASYDRAISFKHDKHEAWYNRGNSLGNLGRDEEAIASYDRAISFKHDKHEAWSNRGVSLDNLGRYEEAIASYDRAISFKHDYHEAWSNRGISLDNLGRYEEAIASYDRAISFKHDYHEAWSNRGNSLDNLGRYEEAIASYDRAISFKHDKHEAWYNRGNSLDNLGRYEEAIASYDRAISFKHDLHEAWSNRGISLDNLGRYEEAIASYDRAISFKHDKHEAWGGRAIALRKLGRYSEAFDSYDQAIAIQPHEPQYFHNKGCAYFKQSRYPESINCFNQAIAIKFDKYDSWHDKGLVYFVLSDYLATIDSWQQAFNYISDPAVPRYYEDISGLIQEFIEELIPRFTQPSIHQTLLMPLLAIYQQANVITELGTALVNTLHLIVAPTISDHTAAEWLSLWRTSSLGNESAMELPLRLMSTAIEYKKDPSKRQRLWLNLPSEERPILNKALKLLD